MPNISKEEIIASSRGWVASILNFLPGLGSGYLYQRRWRPYFLTATSVTAWISIGIILQGDKEPNQTEQLIGILGLFIISVFTMVEANLAYKKAVNKVANKQKETQPAAKKSWFK